MAPPIACAVNLELDLEAPAAFLGVAVAGAGAPADLVGAGAERALRDRADDRLVGADQAAGLQRDGAAARGRDRDDPGLHLGLEGRADLLDGLVLGRVLLRRHALE